MADWFPGEITIGGRVPATLEAELAKAVAATGGLVGGYEGSPFDPDAQRLTEALDGNGHLFLVDDQARYGQFEELEAFCVKHGVAFDRHSEAKHEYDAENVHFRPGMKEPVSVSSNSDGNELLGVERIRPLAKELAQAATGRLSKDKLMATVTKTIRALNRLLPPEVDPLPPLEIEE
jgi:hypothetical protein